MKFALVDGAPATAVPIDDRALHYGDGLFETIAVRAGVPAFLSYHMERLARGIEVLAIPLPDVPALEREIAAAATKLREGILKLIVTRGSAERGSRPPQRTAPRRLLLAYDPAAHPPSWAADGVRVRMCSTRLGHQARLAGLKHLNRLEQVLARSEWQDPTIAEGLMLDEHDNVVCATSANVFIVRGHGLVTPPLDRAGVAGVMRRVVMAIAVRDGIAVAEQTVRASDLFNASELMLSNSVIGLWRVRELEGRALPDDAMWRRLRTAIAACAGQPPR
jgi:4-amino-4-deoxychorismate lyase